MQDTSLSSSHLQSKPLTSNKQQTLLEKQTVFQNIVSSQSTRTLQQSSEELGLNDNIIKIIQACLKQSNINAVLQSKTQFYDITKTLIENPQKGSVNIASQIRSIIDKVMLEPKLDRLVLEEFGFSQQLRNFHNAQSNYQDENPSYIGTVYLKDFMIQVGLIYDIFGQDRNIVMKSHLNWYRIDKILTKIKESKDNKQHQASLISPVLSQQQIHDFKQEEARSIISSFQQTQNQSMIKHIDLFDSTQNYNTKLNQEACEELMAHEDLHIEEINFNPIKKQQNQKILPFQEPQFVDKGLQNMLQQLQSNMQARQQKSIQYLSNNRSSTSLEQQRKTDIQHLHDSLLNNQQKYKMFNEQSLISANNSRLNTPFKPYKPEVHENLFPNNSEQKKTFKNLFQNSPIADGSLLTPVQNKIQQNEPFSNPRSLFLSQTKQNAQIIGQKRMSNFSVINLERNITPTGFKYQTPQIGNKRAKLDFNKNNHTQYQEENKINDERSNDNDSDDDKETGNGDQESKSSISRKKRGLKILSVRVKELVQGSGSTTYKDVATELIKQLRGDKSKMQEIAGTDPDDSFDDCDDLSEDSPNKKGDSATTLQKWEKNVRRRVYDALNVLYAAGVLKKDGKNVSCDTKAIQMTQNLKSTSNSTAKNSCQKNYQSTNDQRMAHHIEFLKIQLAQAKSRVESKRDNLSEQFKHYLSYKNLISRNQNRVNFHPNEQRIALPFILVGTKDCLENEVEISYGEGYKNLNIAMKQPMKCIGDADTLLRLGLYKVHSQWINSNYPEAVDIINLLNQNQIDDIVQDN